MPNSMTQLLDLARSGLLARLFDLENVSTNLANVNTAGYKAGRVNFQEVLNSVQVPSGVRSQATQRRMAEGAMQTTGQQLDLAIDGDGFFAVRLPDGRTAYTRDGHFEKDASGQIVTASGYPLIWAGRLPTTSFDEISIGQDGVVTVIAGGVTTQVGQITLARFSNPSGLLGVGDNMWLESDVSGAAQTGAPASGGAGRLLAGLLESSNVNLASELTQMISLQRAYSMSIRAFEQTDQMFGLAVQMRR
jgi:flagellar basal-body rod protein FlgG